MVMGWKGNCYLEVKPRYLKLVQCHDASKLNVIEMYIFVTKWFIFVFDLGFEC